MVESRLTRMLLRLGAGLTLAFIYVPLFVIGVYAFNENITQTLADRGLHDEVVLASPGTTRTYVSALWLSVKAALGATLIALVLGTLASLAVSRFSFFGRRRFRSSSSCRSRCRGSSPGSRSATILNPAVGIELRRSGRSSSATRPSASSSSTTTRRLAYVESRARSRRHRRTSARTPGRRSAT